MANSFGTETPPAPENGNVNALSSGAMAPPAAGPMPGADPGMPPQGAPQPAPPTQAQTVAALRHFDAVRKEMEIILSDPALGKTTVKSKIIDGMTRLVASRFMKPAEAVTELSKVPAEPLMQMKWAKGVMQQAQTAENAILDHYGLGNPHVGTVQEHFGGSTAPNHDDHGAHLEALMGNYRKPSA